MRRNKTDVVFLLGEMLMLALLLVYMLKLEGAIVLSDYVFLYCLMTWAALAVLIYYKVRD